MLRFIYSEAARKKKIAFTSITFLIFLFCACCNLAYADTYYVDNARASDLGDGRSWATAKKYISSGIAQMSGGDTLYVKNGVYAGISNRISGVPSGSAGNYTKIYAETDWGVTLSNTGQIWNWPVTLDGSSYVEMRGFMVKNFAMGQHFSAVGSNHIKFIRCASDGVVGYENGSFDVSQSQYMLVEECFSWGGGRYPFGTYGSNAYVVFRRCLVRWDFSDTVEPKACFSGYTASHVYFQNCIVINGKDYQGETTWSGVKGFFNPNGGTNYELYGCIVLNFEGAGVWWETGAPGIKNMLLEDCVIWDIKNPGSRDYPPYVLAFESDLTGPITVNRCTLGVSDYNYAIINANKLSITNSIIYGYNSLGAGIYALHNEGGTLTTEDYNCFFGNTRNKATALGAHDVMYDPKANGLEYLARIESGHPLKTAGQSGGQIGAEIMYKRGESSTLYGEAGWNTLTTEPLWPFPNEDVIRTECRTFSKAANELWSGSPAMSGARGFCTDGQTLTKYIWEYLGNTMPSDIYGINGPTNLLAAIISMSSIGLIWMDNSSDEDGFLLERKEGEVGTYALIATLGPNATSFNDTGLDSNTTYYYRVRAFEGSQYSMYSNEAFANTGTSVTGTSDSGGGGGCFIATAAYGTKDSKDLRLLYNFRDNYLLKSKFGFNIVKFYYKTSPGVASYVKHSEMARSFVLAILRPIVLIIKMMAKN